MGHKLRMMAATAVAGITLSTTGCSTPPFPRQAALNSCINDGFTQDMMTPRGTLAQEQEAVTANGEHITLSALRVARCSNLTRSKIAHIERSQGGSDGTVIVAIGTPIAVALAIGFARAPSGRD